MADGHDRYDNRYDNENNGGGSFVMGLLTGTVLGAGLGMLFAPRPGAELRTQLAEQANTLATNAQEGYRRATETAGDLAGKGREFADKGREIADKGREFIDRAKDAVNKGTEEATRYARETAGTAAPGSKQS